MLDGSSLSYYPFPIYNLELLCSIATLGAGYMAKNKIGRETLSAWSLLSGAMRSDYIVIAFTCERESNRPAPSEPACCETPTLGVAL